jgi:hypothetical protein
MFESFQGLHQDFQKPSKSRFDGAIRYDVAQSGAQAIQIQSQIAKKAFDIYVAETSKLSEMCANMIRNMQTG